MSLGTAVTGAAEDIASWFVGAGAGSAQLAAVFSALPGHKAAADAEPRLTAGDPPAPRPDVPDLSVIHTAQSGSNQPNVESTGAEAAAPGESSGNMTGVIDTGGGPR